MTEFGFHKAKHLVGRDTIERLFAEGRKRTLYPFRAIMLPRDDRAGLRLLIVVRKHDCHFATARNRRRRLIREAFRLEQHRAEGVNADLALILLDKAEPDLAALRDKIGRLLDIIKEGSL